MVNHSRPRSAALVPALVAFVVLLLLVASRPWLAGAGESKSKRASGTTTWSSTGSAKVTRTEAHGRDGAGGSYSTTYSDDDEDGSAEVDGYVLWSDDGKERSGSGSTGDWADAQAARKDLDGSRGFWFRRGEDRYLITDPVLLSRLDEMFAPQRELGRRQGLLGRKQGELGRIQGELGRKQGELGRLQAKLGVRQARLSTQVSTLSLRGRETSPLEREMDEVSRQQEEAGELQSELGEQQSALGERQSALGEQQSALGHEQQQLSKRIAEDLGPFTRAAVAGGRARRLEH